MKKLLFYAILGMSTIGFSQPYNYVPWVGATPGSTGTPYAVPDVNADSATKLNVATAGLRFTRFDRTKDGATPQEDDNNTFGRNAFSAFTPTDVNGSDSDRGWITNAPGTLPSPGYYTSIRAHAGGGPRSPGAWMKYTINFTEAGNFNPLIKVRDNGASRNQTFEIKVYPVTNTGDIIYTQITNFSGTSTVNTISTDGTAKQVATITNPATTYWYQILTTVTIPSAGNYVVEISNTQSQGAGGLSAVTFWKQSAAIEPELVITSPQNGAVFEVGNPILLSATAKAGDGSLSGVKFYDLTTDPKTLLGSGVTTGGGVYELSIPATAKVYNFQAEVTETGGVAPDTAVSIGDFKAVGVSDSFDGTNYPGTPWNTTPWSFTADNTANYTKGNTIPRTSAADMYNGIPIWAYDLGSVNRELEKASSSIRYVAGASAVNAASSGIDSRGNNAITAGKTLSLSDDFSRALTVPGAGRFLSSSTDYRVSVGGIWARYSCNFAPGQYKLIVRGSSDVCSGNFNVYARFLKPDGTPVGTTGTVTYNAGQIATGCGAELNITRLDPVATPAYSVFTSPTLNTHWVAVETIVELSGNVIVEISDPDPLIGGNIPGNGTIGEFTFEYVGPALSTTKFQENNLKVYTNGRILNVNYDSLDQASVVIYDINGKHIVSKPLVKGTMTTELPVSGIYLVNVQSKGATKTTKVIVK
jgi:Bacterial Ig domain